MTSPDLDAIRDQVLTAAAAAGSKKASEIAILAVGPLLGITDFFLLLSTGNERQLSAALDEVEGKLRTAHGRKPMGREGQTDAGWVVLDYGDFVVHAFTAEQRAVYDLERLWSDAERVPFIDAEGPAGE
ncbi:MAG TPA: ribosome silencing factor [Euzebya sp.]|nr:ribosome silencing factor [Euzebya sp.]